MTDELIILNEERGVTLSVYLSEKAGASPGPAVIVLPGGGYQLCADGEADPPAFAYRDAGFHAFVLRYTVGRSCRWPLPLDDYEQAAEVIKENAKTWGVDVNKIAVAGFSAGGHLAACAAVSAKNAPAAAILVYPAILYSSFPDAPNPNELVSEKTCPCFLTAARDDNVVDIRNTLAMEQALAEHGVPFESHIYSVGGHAYSIGEASPWGHELSPRLKNWVTESIGWLKEVLV
ncbi:MAG: alpha/beta hydrolase [Lachnospiraceae bacterium]|nr:alpha/beta hydrolase [Lachnospiraceae bacterium]MBR3524394.1 alpha/beta hydrolase [Lachnospiraceae bacterium]